MQMAGPQKREKEAAAFTTGDIKNAAGLTYRQVAEWDGRGLLPQGRGDGPFWRRFTPREIFAVAVCAEIRDQFGVPVQKLKWVMDFMLAEGANHFAWATQRMAYGMAIVLMTDLKTTFVMDTDLDISDMLDLGMFRSEEPDCVVLLKVNPIVNRILSLTSFSKSKLKISQHHYAILRRARSLAVLTTTDTATPEELQVLATLRKPGVKRVEVALKNGKIERADIDDEIDLDPTLDIGLQMATVLKTHRQGRVSVPVSDGEAMRINRKTTVKFPSGGRRSNAKKKSGGD